MRDGCSDTRMAGKVKYLSKSVKFGSKTLVLYSIDGLTWSSKRDELSQIQERQEAQRVTLDGAVQPQKQEGEAEKAANSDQKQNPNQAKAAAPVVKPKPRAKFKPRVAEVIPFPPGVKRGWVPAEVVEQKATSRAKTRKLAATKPNKLAKPKAVVPPPVLPVPERAKAGKAKAVTVQPRKVKKSRIVAKKAKVQRASGKVKSKRRAA